MSAPSALPEAEITPYLLGPYAPVSEEIVCSDPEVIGEIPRDLHGCYYRNGPNPKYAPRGRYHWFDGDGMVHAIHFEDGAATYRNRWVDTRALRAETEAGQSIFGGLIEPDFSNPLGPIKDTANTDVVFHNGEILALWYRSGEPLALDPVTLETRGPQTFSGTRPSPMSAHAKVDPATGELFFFHYDHRPPYMHYGVISADGRLQHWRPVELPAERFPHDLAITRNHAILMDLPVYFDPEIRRHGKWKMMFNRELPARFAIVPRYGDAAVTHWFEAEPCYIYHVINAWEEGPEVVMDVCRVADPVPAGNPGDSALERALKNLRIQARLYRYRFNLETGTTHEAQTGELNTEFPTMNTTYTGVPSRYAYAMHIPEARTLLFDGIVRHDNQTGNCDVYRWEQGWYGSEAPFAPRIGATAEDDGYLVTFGTDAAGAHSECRILDAANIGAGPVARIRIPARVPLGFHACWAPGGQLPG